MYKSLFLIPVACLLLSAPPLQADTANWVLETHWGSRGTGPGELQDPRALAFAANGDIYIADYGNGRIQQFTEDGSFVHAWGAFGDADTRFEFLKGITVDGNGNVYVLDGGHIEKFDADGQYLKRTDEDVDVYGHNLAASPDNIIYTVGSSFLTAFNANLVEVNRETVMGCADDSYAGITITNDLLYVTDSNCQAIDVYNVAGDRLSHWSFAGLSSCFSLAEFEAELFATSPTERAIRILTVDGTDSGRNIAIPELAGEVVYPMAVATHGKHVYVLAGDSVLKFSKETSVQGTTWTEMKNNFQ